MLLSIIIPAYNAENYLGECLDSCLNQDIPKDEYEIIVVNDGSADATLEDGHLSTVTSRCFHRTIRVPALQETKLSTQLREI